MYDPPSESVDPTFGAETLCADVLIVPFNNTKGAGVVALLNEGKGLALIIHEAGNTDTLQLATVDGNDLKNKGNLTKLKSISLNGGISGRVWYRLIMTTAPANTVPATLTVTGKVFSHMTPSDPNSALGPQVGKAGSKTLTYGPLPFPAGVTSPGQNGILGSAITAVLNASVTNFSNDPARCRR